jgi:triphosphoribosyl-dephospho-CoA synthase
MQPELVTHGDIVRSRYGVSGARGEATKNFPHIMNYGLPTLRRQRRAGFAEEVCRLDALLSLMSVLDDTCLLYRGGVEGLYAAQSGARAVIDAGGYGRAGGRIQMLKLDCDLNARKISPGGSADLLAATIFLDAIARDKDEIQKDQSKLEKRYGAA